MMNERRRQLQTVKVDHYDGQAIYSDNELVYELGGYLGGGAAGVVYEAFSTRTKQHVAIKILNPVGYKLFPSTLLARCIVAVKGKPLGVLPPDNSDLNDDSLQHGRRYTGTHRMHSTFGSPKATERLRVENVWWLIHPTSKQAIAAFEDPYTGVVKELTLPQCIQVWGEQLGQETSPGRQPDTSELYQEVQVKNQTIKVPRIPKKFIKFARTRRSIHREISNMSGLEYHENVLRLDEALELVQDSKCTTFLVLELAGGGELFDRIKLDCGTDEETARLYFRQLISGVAFCHNSGICHRDLKPENLLLADNEEHSTLKIADFGLSAIFAFTDTDPSGVNGNGSADQPQSIRRLRSVVGSPHYVAPEVLMDAGQGYDGAKADAWSIGIILYAMIAGNLPFGKDLLKCVRYDRFRKWSYNTKYSDDDPTDEVEFPTWFFPAHFSVEMKSLIAQLLYPDPCMRLPVWEAQRHVWVRGEKLKKANSSPSLEDDQPPSNRAAIKIAGLSTPPPHPSFRSRVDVAVNTLQDDFDLGQQLHPSQLGAVSPQAITRLLSKAPSPHAFRCPPSPQQVLLVNKHLAGVVGYMPSVDETSSMSGQTPINSPRHSKNNSSSEQDLEFESDTSAAPTKKLAACNVSEARELLKQEALVREATMTASIPFSENHAAEGINDATDAATPLTSQGAVTHRHQHRFVSPPLVTGPRDTLPIRFRRNSPPELFLRGYDRGARFREITNFGDRNSSGSAFDHMSILGCSPPLIPQPIASLDEKPVLPTNRSLSDLLKSSEKVGAKDAGCKVPQGGDDDQQTSTQASPPSYNDLVSRSTRFLTALPARLVLSSIELALAANPSPPPYEYSNVPQNVTIDWDNYQLEVRYAGLLTCTVQVFLFQRGVYLVEFRRGHVDIFQFKRFYEKIRAYIVDCMEGGTRESLPTFRKRNNSISEPCF